MNPKFSPAELEMIKEWTKTMSDYSQFCKKVNTEVDDTNSTEIDDLFDKFNALIQNKYKSLNETQIAELVTAWVAMEEAAKKSEEGFDVVEEVRVFDKNTVTCLEKIVKEKDEKKRNEMFQNINEKYKEIVVKINISKEIYKKMTMQESVVKKLVDSHYN